MFLAAVLGWLFCPEWVLEAVGAAFGAALVIAVISVLLSRR